MKHTSKGIYRSKNFFSYFDNVIKQIAAALVASAPTRRSSTKPTLAWRPTLAEVLR